MSSYLQEHKRVWYEVSLLRSIYSHTHSAARMVCITLPPSKTAIDFSLNYRFVVQAIQDSSLIFRPSVSQFRPRAELRYRWPEDKTRILNRLKDKPIIQPL